MTLARVLAAFRPHQDRLTLRETARVATGSALGILAIALLCHAATPESLPWIAPAMGGTAVLLFALPASPLAQPWPTIGGCVISALAGVGAAKLTADTTVAAGLAVGGSLVAMSCLGCLHPPGGAIALAAVVGGAKVTGAGWEFALFPIGLNAALLVAVALVYNNACGHVYPHVPAPHDDAAPRTPISITRGDVVRAMHGYGERLDVDADDVAALVESVIVEASRRAAPERMSSTRSAGSVTLRLRETREPMSATWSAEEA